MDKRIIKTPLDERACQACLSRAGTKVDTIEEAVSLPEICTNQDKQGNKQCRCYIVRDTRIYKE